MDIHSTATVWVYGANLEALIQRAIPTLSALYAGWEYEITDIACYPLVTPDPGIYHWIGEVTAGLVVPNQRRWTP